MNVAVRPPPSQTFADFAESLGCCGEVCLAEPPNLLELEGKYPKEASDSCCHLQPFCFLQSPIRSGALGLSAPMDLPTSYLHFIMKMYLSWH